MTAATARDLEREILRALAERSQAATADAAGVSDTRISRWKDAKNGQGGGLDLEETARVLAALGLRLVRAGDVSVTVPIDKYNALLVLAREFADGELKEKSA